MLIKNAGSLIPYLDHFEIPAQMNIALEHAHKLNNIDWLSELFNVKSKRKEIQQEIQHL